MSIPAELEAEIQRLVDADGLFLLRPVEQGEAPRKVYVAPAVYGDVNGPWPDEEERGNRLAELRWMLDAFTLGERFTVSMDPYHKHPETMLALVDPVKERVWSIRCTAPDPQIRCFGCFAGKDVFVALSWVDRNQMDWSEEVEYCKSEWNRLLSPWPPLKRDSLDDYLSNYRVLPPARR
jgi:hypothetical protein